MCVLLPIKRNGLFLKTVSMFGVFFNSQWLPAFLLAQHLLRVGPWMEILMGVTCHVLSSLLLPSPSTPFLVSIAPLGLCGVPDWASEPAISYVSSESLLREVSLLNWFLVLLHSNWAETMWEGQEEWAEPTAPCMPVDWLIDLWSHHPSD